MAKINLIKVLTIGGTLLSLVGTAVSAYASDKNTEAEIEKRVNEALSNQAKES